MKLFPHQRAGIDWLVSHPRAILADELGLGKTAQVLLATNHLLPLSEGGRCLVVAPSLLLTNWEREIRLWLGSEISVTILDSYAGTILEREVKLLDVKKGFCLINYEALRRMGQGIYSMWDGLILDEAHRVKNRKSQTFKSLRSLARQATVVFLLTGTPVMNETGDLWSLLHLVDRHQFSSYWRFVQEFANVYQNKYGWVVEGTRNVEDLQSLLKNLLLRREKDKVLDLPSKVVKTVWLKMSQPQAQAYSQMKEKMRTQLLSGRSLHVTVNIAQLTRLRQISVSPTLLEEELLPLLGPKVEVILDLCKTDLPLVVFSQFAKALLGLKRTLDKEGFQVETITGETSNRQKILDRFTSGKLDVLGLSTSLSEGISLVAGRTTVFLDKMWTPARNIQAQDRLHRLGQFQLVTIVEPLMIDTVEEYVEDLLQKKIKISQEILSRDFLERVLT